MKAPSTTVSDFDSRRGGARWVPLAVLLLSGLACFLLLAPVAGAAEFHPFKYEIDGTGTTAGQFTRLDDLALHQSTGTLYAWDRGSHSIDKFDAAGNPQNFAATGQSSLSVYDACPGYEIYQYGGAGIGVDSSGTANDGTLYVAGETGGVCAFNPAGEYLWRLHGPENPEAGGACGATTDPLGRLWVLAGGLLQYTATGSPPTFVTVTEPAGACRAAIGEAGRIYIGSGNNPDGNFDGTLERWSVLGPQEEILGKANGSVGLDPSNEHIYAGHDQQVDEFTPEGEKVGQIGSMAPYTLTGEGTIGRSVAIAARGSTGEVFIADADSQTLKVYGPRQTFPDVTTGSASSIRRNSTQVSGQVTPDGGAVTDCRFEWGPTESYGDSVPCDQVPPFAGATNASAGISGLSPGTTYHYRLVAENANGPNWGADQTFTTPFVNGVQTTAATGVTKTSATLNGSLAPDGIETHYYFEWGPDQSYGNTAPAPPGANAGSGSGSTPATTAISGLAFGTTYHYRLVASNVEGTTYGDDVAFRTLDAVAAVETLPATEVAQQQATLNGTLNPEGQPATFYFEWGPTVAYGNTTATAPGEPAGSGNGPTPVSALIEGLTSYTSYHYRLVASNATGTTYGEDQVVITEPPLLPTIAGSAATGVTASSVVLSGAINPGYGLTVYRFEYGTDTDYGSRTSIQGPLEENGTTQPVGVTVLGLAPGTTYHYRLVATNFTGTVKGPDQAFTTPGPPDLGAIAITRTSSRTARLETTINPMLAATTYRVEYGGTSTGEISLGTVENAPRAVAVELTGLSPGTRYQLRVVATNAQGVDLGDHVFNTQSEAVTPRPAPCKKPRVKRRGRCVKKHSKRRHQKKHGGRGKSRAGAKAEG